MPVQIIFLFTAFLALAWCCGFVGANLGAAMKHAQGAGVPMLGAGAFLAIGFVVAECILFAQTINGRPNFDLLRFPILLMVVGLGCGNVLSVWLGTARATLLGAMIGALVGVVGLIFGVWILMASRGGAALTAMMSITILPAIVGGFAGAALSGTDEDWMLEAARLRAAQAGKEGGRTTS